MPIFEYICRDCDHAFETLVTASRQPECPKCHGAELAKQPSVFAAVSAPSSSPGRTEGFGQGACGACGDPRGPGSCSVN
jgi:putative FmdB family regulatory protein